MHSGMRNPRWLVLLLGALSCPLFGCSPSASGASTPDSSPDPSRADGEGRDPRGPAPGALDGQDASDASPALDGPDDGGARDVSDGGHSADGARDAGGDDTDGDAPSSLAPVLPTPTAPCPAFRDGTVRFRVRGSEREVVLIFSDAALTVASPLVFFWYGTDGDVTQFTNAYADVLDAMKARGIVVASPKHVGGGFPWIGGKDEDLELMDEVVGCANAALGLDARRIHSIGFSAGGLFNTDVAYKRAAYVASIASYSGGLEGTPPRAQRPEHKFAALLVHGGAADSVFINFKASTERLKARLDGDGHMAIVCDHASGHVMPKSLAEAVVQFFADHPYGRMPSPYERGLPPSLAACVR
jgi:predicted esterase